jgi:predicted P-loop ATPase
MAKKPEWLSDEDWAVFKREHNLTDDDEVGGGDGKVVQFDKTRKRKKPPPTPPPGGWPAWLPLLRRDDRGRVIADLANVLIALRNEQGYADAFAFDEMAQAINVTHAPPIVVWAEAGKKPPRLFDPEDITRTQDWLQQMGILRVGPETVRHAIELRAKAHAFHPLRDWLNGLEHDGDPKIGSWLHVCLGAPDDEYHRQIGAMFLIAMVARIFEPGCKADYMLILEGFQGEEKSKFCRVLAGGDAYFSEHLPRIDGDQVRLSTHLRGLWLVEVAELSAMLKSDPEGTKHFISRQIEKYLPKYGRGEVVEPRQCLFVGTTNDDDYIRDATGGRRYWPVVITKIDIEALAAMRDQLFAEAVDAYRSGKPWWPDREFEKAVITPIQDDRQFEDALSDRVHEIIEPLSSITLAQLGAQLGFDNTKFDMMAQKRIGAILKRAKWKKGQKHGGGKIWRKAEET